MLLSPLLQTVQQAVEILAVLVRKLLVTGFEFGVLRLLNRSLIFGADHSLKVQLIVDGVEFLRAEACHEKPLLSL